MGSNELRLEKRVKVGGGERGKERKELEKKRGLVVLGRGEENLTVLFRYADQESKTRMRNNALRTGPRQDVETTQPTSRIGTLTSTFVGLKEDTCIKDSLAADQR
ncbi:hypothetical protein TNCV_4396871 [Trichonephila clavipes]|uniref:Uncharacterized protein n=1 Tax=Trichonephila clavipes TaxID=2585209 RepID=A0A8X6W4W5_TRICX|nr:hypothetical protein TNCV_4396871 [Trichonephila clavipes]